MTGQTYLVRQQNARDGTTVGEAALGVKVAFPLGRVEERFLARQVKHDDAGVRVAVVDTSH